MFIYWSENAHQYISVVYLWEKKKNVLYAGSTKKKRICLFTTKKATYGRNSIQEKNFVSLLCLLCPVAIGYSDDIERG